MDMTMESCRKFVEVLASNAPAPGGGGAAALVGAIGTALGNMVGSLTVGKKKYAAVEEEIIALQAKCDQLQKDLNRRPFDFVIGSVHLVGDADIYLEPYWADKSYEEAIRLHLETTLECVRAHEDYDVLGHLTYISKCTGNPRKELLRYEDHKPIMDEILRELVKRGKGMELNTSGFDRCGGSLPTLDYFQRFYDLGGRIVTVGSDSHDTARVGQYTHEMVAELKKIFGYVCTFENRKPIFHE